MTPFALLVSLAGLSHREAVAFLGVSLDSVRGWINGRRTAPPAILDKLRTLILAQEMSAGENLSVITGHIKSRPDLAGIDIGYPADDHEAQALGFPCVGAWQAMVARIIAAAPIPVRLVPRGSTVSTAAAADAHGK